MLIWILAAIAYLVVAGVASGMAEHWKIPAWRVAGLFWPLSLAFLATTVLCWPFFRLGVLASDKVRRLLGGGQV